MAVPVGFAELSRIESALKSLRFDQQDPAYASAFDRFGEMLAKLTAPERQLVAQLVSDFLVYHDTEYLGALRVLLRRLDIAEIATYQELVVLPLSETKSDGAPKSASTLVYPAANALKENGELSSLSIRSFERMEHVLTQMPSRTRSYFIFVDDFIGTGDTALDTIDRFRKTIAKPEDRFVVLSLVAQQKGLDAMTSVGAPHIAKDVCSRGISDSTTLEDRDTALSLMDDIERRMRVEADYRRGWKRSEALVKMIRCPDNTFPIFWRTKKERPWPAPFPRE